MNAWPSDTPMVCTLHYAMAPHTLCLYVGQREGIALEPPGLAAVVRVLSLDVSACCNASPLAHIVIIIPHPLHRDSTRKDASKHGGPQEEHAHEGTFVWEGCGAAASVAVAPCVRVVVAWRGEGGREGIMRGARSHTLTPFPALPLLQRLKHVVALGYSYCRPVAYYGMIPFVLYVGMNGDAAPNWSDLPRYLIAVL